MGPQFGIQNIPEGAQDDQKVRVPRAPGPHGGPRGVQSSPSLKVRGGRVAFPADFSTDLAYFLLPSLFIFPFKPSPQNSLESMKDNGARGEHPKQDIGRGKPLPME